MTKNVDVIGAGLSGLYAACYLAKNGYQVNVYEKNDLFSDLCNSLMVMHHVRLNEL